VWPYMLSEQDAVRFLGLTPDEFRHFVWLKQIHPYPGGERLYYPRVALQEAMADLFVECQEFGARLPRLSAKLFWEKYDEKYGSSDRKERSIKTKMHKVLRYYSVVDVARAMNFGNCMDLSNHLSQPERARIVDVFMELGVLTDLGKAYHACVMASLESE